MHYTTGVPLFLERGASFFLILSYQVFADGDEGDYWCQSYNLKICLRHFKPSTLNLGVLSI
jgi:hypothetical protein